jgi:hypothetical protein
LPVERTVVYICLWGLREETMQGVFHV